MTSVRAAKSKGSSFEYDCQHSLKKLFPDIYRTSERGFQMQYDLHSESGKMVFECKRLKGISWNQLDKFYEKLEKVKPYNYGSCLLFKSNRQPCLVFYIDDHARIVIESFEDVFGVPFEKHPSTRPKQKT